MNVTEFFNTAADLIVLANIVPLTVFIVLYRTRSPWDANELGVALMFQKISFLLVTVVINLSLIFAHYPGREFVRVSVYLLIFFFLWLDVANLRHYQKKYPFDKSKHKRRTFRQMITQRFED